MKVKAGSGSEKKKKLIIIISDPQHCMQEWVYRTYWQTFPSRSPARGGGISANAIWRKNEKKRKSGKKGRMEDEWKVTVKHVRNGKNAN